MFDNSEVTSIYLDAGQPLRRSFAFNLADDTLNPIKNFETGPAASTASTGTRVSLGPFQTTYGVHCPRKLETIAAHLVGHFLRYFVAHQAPLFTIKDRSEILNLTDFYGDNLVSEKASTSTIQIDGRDVKLDEFHVLLKKSLRFHESGKHFLVYVGDGRVVRQQNIDNQLGLNYIGPDKDCIYLGLISSPYLDTHVNQERTRFTFSDDTFDSVHKGAIAQAKEYLSDYIEVVREKQAETALNVIRENPMFLSVTDDVGSYVREHLSLSTQKDEDIYLELSRSRRRISREIKRDISKLSQSTGEALEQKVKKITDALNAEKKGSLAAYVAQRKAILELLDSSLSYADPEARNYLKEERVHELIIPIRSDNDQLNYDDHNLWILDDRLAFYSYFKSDKPFRTFLTDSDSGKEPDIAVVFDRSLAFNREGNDEPVVIVEFKRPGRTSYGPSDNPVTQVLDYVKIMRKGGSFVDSQGKVKKPIPDSTRFICFIVADFTEQLIDLLETSVAQHRSADGEGFFGFSAPHNAFIEVIPYSKMLHDARLRNEAFFAKLGLQ